MTTLDTLRSVIGDPEVFGEGVAAFAVNFGLHAFYYTHSQGASTTDRAFFELM